ncbi:MAG TPA: protein kinase [Planctomycetota bacterium]|nr:protein kinase [Planctomycetota bacterium]
MKVDYRSFRGLSRFLAPSAGGPIADRALAEKRITPEQLEKCVRIQDRTGRPLDEILLDQGLLTSQDVVRFRNPALPPDVDKASQDPKNIVAQYVLLSRAGMGGMAEVWKAWDRSLGRWVAIKFLKDEIGHPSQRIEREGMMAGQLSHPGIITIFERGEKEGRPYLVMPLVDGAPPKAPLAPKAAARLALQASQALVHVHKMGIIHRDVKPANILVEAGGRVLLLDFGLAIPASSGASRWAVSGTPEYASPEQIRGDVLDARTDVYSLGATLYHLLAGRPPFGGASVKEITDRVLTAPLPPLKAVPRQLARIVAKAMERDRAKRYPTMTALARDLQGFLDPIFGVVPSTPRALVAVLVAGALPWMITGIIVWQRNRREARIELMQEVRGADQELARTEQLFGDSEVPLDSCRASAAETLALYKAIGNQWGQDTSELKAGTARCLELLGQEGEAESLYSLAMPLPSAGIGLARLRLKRYFAGQREKDWRKEAVKALESIKTSRPVDTASLLLAFASGRYSEVLAADPKLLDQGRYDDIVQMCVGASAVETKSWEEAIRRFEQAAKLRRGDATSLYWKGIALAGRGERMDAITAFDQALRSAPADWALLAEAQRQLDEARR